MEEPLDSHMGVFAAPCYSNEFAETDPAAAPSTASACRWRAQRRRLPGHGLPYRATPRPGAPTTDWFKEHFDHVLVVHVQRGPAGGENRVTLDPQVTDSDGIPAAHVEYELHPNDRALAGLRRRASIFEADPGGRRVQRNDTSRAYQPPAWHLLGTCRMGNTPRGLGHQQVAPELGRAQPLHLRRQSVVTTVPRSTPRRPSAPWPCAPASTSCATTTTSPRRRRRRAMQMRPTCKQARRAVGGRVPPPAGGDGT